MAVRFSKKGNLPAKSPFGKNESSICKTMLIVKTNILGDKQSKTTQLCSVTNVSLNYGIGSSFKSGKTYCAETAYPSLSAQVIIQAAAVDFVTKKVDAPGENYFSFSLLTRNFYCYLLGKLGKHS